MSHFSLKTITQHKFTPMTSKGNKIKIFIIEINPPVREWQAGVHGDRDRCVWWQPRGHPPPAGLHHMSLHQPAVCLRPAPPALGLLLESHTRRKSPVKKIFLC